MLWSVLTFEGGGGDDDDAPTLSFISFFLLPFTPPTPTHPFHDPTCFFLSFCQHPGKAVHRNDAHAEKVVQGPAQQGRGEPQHPRRARQDAPAQHPHAAPEGRSVSVDLSGRYSSVDDDAIRSVLVNVTDYS